ncbi:MAG: hypothetical protein DRP71_15605 [Verrucomicrobia bacterium]|nr:MAG: hypothetical protein DRP71_15605 [Verrucomicrobiota bacterium]
MELTAEHKDAVSHWITDGASIAEVQKRLKDDFKIALTYMEARFLIDDLDLSLKDSEKASIHTDLGVGVGADASQPPPSAPAAGPADVIDLEPAGTGSVSVEVDKITRPGMVVSGDVVFSDGVKATWGLDQMGRLALDPGQSGYQPSAEDIEVFQQALSKQLQKQGF